MQTVPAGQVMHGQDGDTVADVADAHLVRADTEHVLGDTNHLPERTTLGNLHAWTPHSPGGRTPLSSPTSKECPTWRAHHQDFYASKWFRSIQIFTICTVIIAALILYLFVSPALEEYTDIGDLFASYGILFVLLPIFLGPVAILLFVVVGGMRWSKVFQ